MLCTHFLSETKKTFRERTLKNPTGQQGWLFCCYIGSRGALTFVHFLHRYFPCHECGENVYIEKLVDFTSRILVVYMLFQFLSLYLVFSPLVCDSSFRPLGYPETEKRNLPLIKFPPLSLNGKQFGGISPPPLFSLRPRLSRFGTVGENSPSLLSPFLGEGKKCYLTFSFS